MAAKNKVLNGYSGAKGAKNRWTVPGERKGPLEINKKIEENYFFKSKNAHCVKI